MIHEITPRDLAHQLANGSQIHLLDVRQPWENQIATLVGSKLIPMGELPYRTSELDGNAGWKLVVFCHHGIRSLSAAEYLERVGFQNVHSLAGGIDAWSCEIDPSIPRY